MESKPMESGDDGITPYAVANVVVLEETTL